MLNIKEQPNYTIESEEEEDDYLKLIATKYGIIGEIPTRGKALERLSEIAEKYANRVMNGDSSSLKISEKFRRKSEGERRMYHDQLCKMIFGTSHKDTSPDNRERVAKFALHASGYGSDIKNLF